MTEQPKPYMTEVQPEMKVYVYIKGSSGQELCGYFPKEKLPNLVKHFIECEDEPRTTQT